MRTKRCSRIIMTNEARVLKQMRTAKGLSMRKAGELLGKSDTYIAHIENGRMDVPTGPKLDELLTIYDGPKQKSFYERARIFKHTITPKDELISLIERIDESKVSLILKMAQSMVG